MSQARRNRRNAARAAEKRAKRFFNGKEVNEQTLIDYLESIGLKPISDDEQGAV